MSNNVSLKRLVLLMMFVVLASSLVYGQTRLTGSFTDSRDGQTYRTIKIGGRWWMAQNLNYATEIGSWTMENDSTGSQFGRFYNWEAAKKAVPVGWHLPSKQEFQTLLDSLGGNDEELYLKLIKGGESGFNVLLTGSHQQAYGRRGGAANIWSSTLWWFSSLFGLTENPWRLGLGSHKGKFYAQIGHFAESDYGFNVRCVQDE
jgi:uncharacterized protein (TIGR02145 family)